MSQFSSNHLLIVLAVVLSSMLSLGSASAQKPEAKTESKQVASAEKAPAKAKGRLPAYYKDIVDAKQKDRIYSVQTEFNTKIEALEAEIKKLTSDRDAAIENVLTVDQKDKLKKAKEEAAAKRKKPSTEAKETAEVKSE